ncbi:MAG: methionine--tRNA ligase [Wenzhouxiangellaceae bacterium]
MTDSSAGHKRRILITSALPYANGPLHLGHMLEAIQTDIWSRFQRSRGHLAYYVCADDTHGTPIMLHAQSRDITPEQLIAEIGQQHQADFRDFGIACDLYGSTHSASTRELAYAIYERLNQGGHIERRTIKQLYDTERGMFLPDRFIKGECPKCGAADQYGDSCEVCSSTYNPTDLKNPRSVVSGSTPELRDSEHYFFRLADFSDTLAGWIESEALQEEVRNKLKEWFEDGLRDWDISRDEPYFGFAIPGADDKYFYVWVDAPVGYLATFRDLCKRDGLPFDHWLQAGSETEMVHFIGKDIIYFHALFWPAMLHGAGLRMPSAVYAHGFLTVNGAKMSKSRGTFIQARTYLDHLEADYLRYYFAAKLGNGLADIDLSMDDFLLRVNADLVGKLVNIASRTASFINKRFDGKLAAALPDPDLYQRFVDASEDIAEAFEQRRYAAAIRQIMALADEANRYLDEHKPWVLIKQEETAAQVHGVCTQALNLFRVLMTWLAPVIPATAARAASFLREPLDEWDAIGEPLLDHTIERFTPLLTRIEERQLEEMVEASRPAGQEPAAAPAIEFAEEITIDDFTRIDLRVARIVKAEAVAEADKLLRLELDVGGVTRQVFAGIKKAYDPATLEGRLTIMLANLKPRKMRFGLSEGMVLAASNENGGPFLLAPDDGAEPGMRIS